jgi:purine-nucleoside phosphorylase
MAEPGMLERIDAAAAAIRNLGGVLPQTAVVLGSGLGGLEEMLADRIEMSVSELPYWPRPQVIGHSGRLVVGTFAGRRVAVVGGRVHAYEGRDPRDVVFATRVMGRLGVRQLVLTNAAGGVNAGLRRGALMVIDDHINLQGANPLVGDNDDRLGPRFPDMTEVYSRRLRGIADEAAAAVGVSVAHGVYAALLGPSYETPAEIRYLRTIGVDAVGMSTVLEAIAARHMGLEVLGLSCIANMAAGVWPEPLDHDDVRAATRRAQGPFVALLGGIIERL